MTSDAKLNPLSMDHFYKVFAFTVTPAFSLTGLYPPSMKKYCRTITLIAASLFAIAIFSPATINAQHFSGFDARRMGDNLTLTYSIEGEQVGQMFSVTPYYSADDGATWQQLRTTWGNVGPSVTGGSGRTLVWDVLEDTGGLNGDILFRLSAEPSEVQNPAEESGDFLFELQSLHRLSESQVEAVLNVTNNGEQRDLKIFNRMVSVTGFNGRRYEAQWGRVGDVTGPQRYHAPQKTMRTGESVTAVFRFDRIPGDLDRVMRLDLGVELLTITFGVDLETGHMQFRDLPVTPAPAEDPSRLTASGFEATLTAFVDIEPEYIEDNTPPALTITSPAPGDFTDNLLRINEGILLVEGVAEDESGISMVTVNGHDASAGPDGTFAYNLNVSAGYNEVVVRAIDTRFNSIEKRLDVYYDAPSGEERVSGFEELEKVITSGRPPRYFAFIVGVEEYPDPWILPLYKPIYDARKLADVLTEHYLFDEENVILMENPTRADMIDELDRFTRRITEDDNLLIFFAGHGYFDMDTELGYWLPNDATGQSTANWMANSQIRDYIGAIKSNHTLLISDACFAGGIFQVRGAFPDTPSNVDRFYTSPSRKAMTSGNLTEVPDESIFLRYLVQRLEENTRSFILAEELFSSFKTIVTSQTSTIPRYGDIKGTGDQGGDFVFIRRER
ncbi:MAG: caspase family protein [Marinilabiliales bacterium]|nr:MAG: caspase family protein [Marinilabiliales bacterium]